MVTPKPRVLLAEGNADARSALMWCLAAERFWVEPVSNGFDAALAFDREELPDVAIIDLGLSGVSGRQLIDHAINSQRLAGIRLIATSTSPLLLPLPPRVGFVKKPCRPAVLAEEVRSMLGASSAPSSWLEAASRYRKSSKLVTGPGRE
jgi:DNA-binding response OmpR family regulator